MFAAYFCKVNDISKQDKNMSRQSSPIQKIVYLIKLIYDKIQQRVHAI